MDDDGVIVDVVLEGGVLYLELANLASRPALSVTCAFDPPLVDAAGRDVSTLRLFKRMPFLGPDRRVRTLLDSVPGYFARKAPARTVVTVTYARPGERNRAETKVTHDLAVYRELAYRV
jgi:hypothetical protein